MVATKIHNSLIAWNRVLLEQLIGAQLIKKFRAFYGAQNFITMFTVACHLFLT